MGQFGLQLGDALKQRLVAGGSWTLLRLEEGTWLATAAT